MGTFKKILGTVAAITGGVIIAKKVKESIDDKNERKKQIQLQNLEDEKRKNIRRFDEIEFTHVDTNEKIYVWVKHIHHYKSFEELYENFDKVSLGYQVDEVANPIDMERFYSSEKIKKYGVLGIEIELLEKGKSQVEMLNNTIKIVEEITKEKI